MDRAKDADVGTEWVNFCDFGGFLSGKSLFVLGGGIMIAVFVNMGTVLLGSTIGLLFRKKIKEEYIGAVVTAIALITLVIGISSAVASTDMICMIVCMALGTIFGTWLQIDRRIEGAGEFVKQKLLRGAGGGRFTEGFVSACILFCVGSMTIMGSFEAGINQNHDIIFAKSALDFVSSMMYAAAMGIGVSFSVFFILLFQGGLTLLAGALAPFLGGTVVTEMSAVGGVILLGLGINLLELGPKKIKIANMLPAIFLPIAYLPFSDWIGAILQKI